jgi:hypothetical protein
MIIVRWPRFGTPQSMAKAEWALKALFENANTFSPMAE